MRTGESRLRRRTVLVAAAICLTALAGPGTAAAGLQPLPVVDLFTDDRCGETAGGQHGAGA